jgi:hypothetical protein
MTVHRRGSDDAIILEGSCSVEDAEPLLQMLQATPGAAIEWVACQHLHTAVFQLILASGVVPKGPCGDAWIAEWLAPKPRASNRQSGACATGMELVGQPAIYPLSTRG